MRRDGSGPQSTFGKRALVAALDAADASARTSGGRTIWQSPANAVAARPRQRRWHSLASGLVGFAVGALFWHMIGFWGFVTTVVLKGPIDDRVRTAAEPPLPVVSRELRPSLSWSRAPARSPKAPQLVQVMPESCSSLHLDRTVGTTSLIECVATDRPLPEGSAGARGDFLAIAKSATGDIAPGASASPDWRLTVIDPIRREKQ